MDRKTYWNLNVFNELEEHAKTVQYIWQLLAPTEPVIASLRSNPGVKITFLYCFTLFISPAVRDVPFHYPIFSWIASQARNDGYCYSLLLECIHRARVVTLYERVSIDFGLILRNIGHGTTQQNTHFQRPIQLNAENEHRYS